MPVGYFNRAYGLNYRQFQSFMSDIYANIMGTSCIIEKSRTYWTYL